MSDQALAHGPIQVAFVGDPGVIEPIAVAVRSLQRATQSPDVGIHVVAVDWAEAHHRHARSLMPPWVRIIDVGSERLPGVRSGLHVTTAANALLLLPDLLLDLDRVLYLDADVLVRDARIDELWHTELGEYAVAAVPSIGQTQVAAPNGIIGWRALGLDPRAPVFNSGVLLLDLRRIRDGGVFERALDHARSFSHLTHLPDQHALNAALNGQWLRLSPVFNSNYRQLHDMSGAAVVFGDDEITAALTDPAIVHFVGRMKPWMRIPDDGFVLEWRTVAASLGLTALAPYREPPSKRQLEEQVASLTKRAESLEKRRRAAESKLARLRASRSYRLGQAVTRPLRPLRRLRRRSTPAG